jgi:hypothetical protein
MLIVVFSDFFENTGIQIAGLMQRPLAALPFCALCVGTASAFIINAGNGPASLGAAAFAEV